MARSERALRLLHAEIVDCRACPRLVRWREEVAREKRRMYRDQDYWGRPITGFGDPAAALVIMGLAPAAHGGNRTGRIFTGDRSGDFLFAGLHRAGIANQPTSVARDDGLALAGAYIVAPVRCAPPDNLPTPKEFARCARWLDAELALIPNAFVYLCLGAHAWKATLEHLERRGMTIPRPRPVFGHGAVARITREGGEARVGGADDAFLVGSYHVSQQNTQTGRLAPAMFDQALAVARTLASERVSAAAASTKRGSRGI